MGYTYYQRRVRAINVDVATPGSFHVYHISPVEHNSIFTAYGSVANDATPVIFVLPAIQEQGPGLVFTFKAGPNSRIIIAAHNGKLTPLYTYCEGVVMGQFESTYTTKDVISADPHASFISWDSTNNGGVNATVTLQSHGVSKAYRGGRWNVTHQVGDFTYSTAPPVVGPSWDWYECLDRFPWYGGNLQNEAGYVNVSQGFIEGTPVADDIPSTWHPDQIVDHINQDDTYHERQLLWNNGERPELRGMMISQWTFDAAAVAELGNEWGANVIRWQHGPGGFPSSPADGWTTAQYKDWLYNTSLPKMDAQLQNCADAGINVLIDVHTVPGGWATDNPTGSGYHRIFWDQDFQDCFIDIWDYIATKYKNDDRIWGYDLANEPHDNRRGPVTYNGWNELKQHVSERVRAIDPDKPIVLGCAHGPPIFFSPIPIPALAQVERTTTVTGVNNVIYQAHMYEPGAFTNQGLWNTPAGQTYPSSYDYGWPLRWMAKREIYEYLQSLRDFQINNNLDTIYMGEFSTIRYAETQYRHKWMRDILDIYEEYGWDWTWHAWREFDGWSLEHYEGAANSGVFTNAAPTESEYLMRRYLKRNKYGVDESGSYCTNSGTPFDFTYKLPPAEAGKYFWFSNQRPDAAANLIVEAYEGDVIQKYDDKYTTTAGDKQVFTDVPGADIQLVAADDTNWYPVKETPSWSGITYSGLFKGYVHVPGLGNPSVTDYYITAHESGTHFTCSGATTPTTFHLPPAQAGLEYFFTPYSSRDGRWDYTPTGHAWPLTAQAAAGDFIVWPYVADGTYTKMTSSGHHWNFGLRAYDNTGWYTCLNYGGSVRE